MNSLIAKEAFVKIIEDFKFVHDYQDKLNLFYKDNGCEGYLYQPDCTKSVLDLLHIIFDDEDNWLEYFIFDLDFGRVNIKDAVINKNGDVINLSSSEDLYEILMN